MLVSAQVIGNSWAGLGFAGCLIEGRDSAAGFGSFGDWLEAKHGGSPIQVCIRGYWPYILALADMMVAVAFDLMDRCRFEGSRSGESVDWVDTGSHCWIGHSVVVVGKWALAVVERTLSRTETSWSRM